MPKSKVYCNILKYLENEHSALADILDDRCLSGLLVPRRGITFLIPTTADIKEIESLLDSGNKESVENADNLLKSYILSDVFHSAEDFTAESKHVVNKAGIQLAVNVKGASVEFPENEIIISNLDILFSNDLYAVWQCKEKRGKMKEGGLGLLKGESFDMSSLRRPKKKREVRGGGHLTDRKEIEHMLLQKYLNALAYHRDHPETKFCNPYFGAIVSLAETIRLNTDPNLTNFTDIDYMPEVTFYLWVQPFKTVGMKRISDDIIKQWGGSIEMYKPVTSYKNLIDGLAQAIGVTDRQQQQIATWRQSNGGNKISKSTPQSVVQLYNNVDPTGQRQWQDEFRLIFGLKFLESQNSTCPSSELKDICRTIASSWPGNDYKKECMITSKRSMDNASFMSFCVPLVNSNFLLYTPSQTSQLPAISSDTTIDSFCNPESAKDIHDFSAFEFHQYKNYADEDVGLSAAVSAIQTYKLLNNNQLPPGLA